MAQRDPDVDRWMRGKPAEPLLRRLRDVIMWADARMTEYLKYGTVQFACNGGDFATFVRHGEKKAELMFNRGARIPGRYRYLEGSGPTARHMRFADLADVELKTQELANLAVAWCDMMAPRVPRSGSRRRALAKGPGILRRGRKPRSAPPPKPS